MAFFKYKNIIEVFQHNPKRYFPLTQLIQNIMRGESAFSAGERELIAAYVSGLNGCDFCYGSHQAIAADLNVDPKLLEAILTDIKTAPVDERLRPVLAFVHKVTLNPSKTTQSDVDAILEAGWDEQAIEDALGVCALFNFMNRLVDGYGLESPSREQLTAMAKGINTHGYDAFVEPSN